MLSIRCSGGRLQFFPSYEFLLELSAKKKLNDQAIPPVPEAVSPEFPAFHPREPFEGNTPYNEMKIN